MLSEQHKKFCEAVKHAADVFNKPKHRKKYKDLSPRFWVALMDLELSCDCEDWKQLKTDFAKCYRFLGAPGDFGYGTPCGDALRAVYDSWNKLYLANVPRTGAVPAAEVG